jgi:carbon-monoxide dehydrogenase medium subunit
MYAFEYVRPASLDEAVSALGGESASALAGGQTLLPTLKQRLASHDTLVDVRHLAELRGIEAANGVLTIGAGITHAEVAGSSTVRDGIPALAVLAGGIGDPQVRNLGTLGGSIANNDPASDYPAAVLGLGATVVTNARAMDADSFFQGLFETALEDGELITAVRFPVPRAAAYRKFDQPASRFALTGVFVARTDTGTRVAVTGAGEDGVFRHAGLEAALNSAFSVDAANGTEISADDLIEDLHGSPAYRANLIRVMAARAVADCA